MESSLFEALARMTLGASVAILLVLPLRATLRLRFGARISYHVWLLVPVLMIAAVLPSMHVNRVIAVQAMPTLAAGPLAAPVAQAVPVAWTTILLSAWLAGALATALLLAVAQRRYVRSLGSLTARDNVYLAATTAQGPALLGLWRPRIVLPADFAQRYSAQEQQLIIAHEQCHVLRHDALVNALVALLQCAFWFHPLIHLAAARCRFDQELACDADVLQRHPGQARVYGAALLNTQAAGAFAPATCHWQSNHPLKERIMQLNHSKNNPARRWAGRAMLAFLLAGGIIGTVVARAESEQKTKYLVELKITFAGEYSSPSVLIGAGEPFTLSGATRGKTWSGDFVVTEDKGDMVWLRSQFTIDGKYSGDHNGGIRLGESKHVAIMSEAGADTMILVLDGSVKRAPAPASQ
ncbi:Signal transducer regulating beta-lactamase production, contains metallopeptidase domain [Massilia sp. CF038]|nr:Signal transducer regulating beta-lactamase production, contains metallopeptidase domain [Massilia sp. CF038]